MTDYARQSSDDPAIPLAEILSDALIGLKASVTIDQLSGAGLRDTSALIRTEDGRAFTITVRREYERDRH